LVKAKVSLRGKLALITLETGAQALVPVEEVCNLARRFRLELEEYYCEETPLQSGKGEMVQKR